MTNIIDLFLLTGALCAVMMLAYGVAVIIDTLTD